MHRVISWVLYIFLELFIWHKFNVMVVKDTYSIKFMRYLNLLIIFIKFTVEINFPSLISRAIGGRTRITTFRFSLIVGSLILECLLDVRSCHNYSDIVSNCMEDGDDYIKDFFIINYKYNFLS